MGGLPYDSGSNERAQKRHQTNSNKNSNIYLIVPYTKGLVKAVRMYMVRWESRYILMGSTQSESSWWPLRTRISSPRKSGIIYRFKGAKAKSEGEYISDLARTFEKRFKEHLRPPPHL